MDTTNEGTSFDRPGFIESGESLLRRIAELERDLAALRHERNVLQKICAERSDELAAAQATIQQVRDIAQNIAEYWNGGGDMAAVRAAEHARDEAAEILALPSDRTALDAMLAEARKDQAEKIERLENDIRWRDKEILMLRDICVKRDAEKK